MSNPTCRMCGDPIVQAWDIVQTDDGPVCRGACHQRALLDDDGVDSTRKLHAALELWDLRVHPLVRVVIEGRPLIGVIVNHHPKDGWDLEDQGGGMHTFWGVESVEVIEDAFAA